MKHGSQQRFSIRKYSFGAASVLIASLAFMGGQVQADSLAESSASTEATSQTVASSITEVVAQITSEPTPASSQKEVEPSTETSSVAQAELVPSESVSSASESKVETKVTPEVQPASSKVESPATVSSSSSSPVVAPSVNPVRRAATAGNPNVATLPDSGTYVFEEKTAVHSQPNLSSTVVATYQKGQSVIYDRLLSADERLWLSYIGASGARRYVALPAQNQSGQTTDSAVANTLNALAPQGTYTFSKTAGVKNEARLSSPDLVFYSPGQSVRYDRVLTAENHRWISYISYSGFRRYVAIEELPQVPKVEKTGRVSTANVSSSGYDVVVTNVNHPAGVKEVLVPSWSEKTGQDDIIWHKAVKQSDGSYKVRVETNQHKQDFGAYHSHVYYVTNQNKREYVTETKVMVPEPKTSVRVENITVVGFDVTIKGLATNPDVREVLVPTWTTNKGQDDLIWYKALKQDDGSYKARIDYSRHQYDFGNYTVHAYFKDSTGKMNWLGNTSVDFPKPSNYGKGYPVKWMGEKKYSGVITHVDENPVYSDTNRVNIDRIVIHHNAGMSDEGARATWYIRNGNETSAHYQVTPDKVWGVVPENEVAWHAGHYPTNQRSIGIEHLNNSLGPNWTIAEETYRNSAKLIADISIRYNIPLDRTHVIGHDEVSATLCPGGIDMDKLLSMARAERAKLENTTMPKTSAVPSPVTPQKVEIPYYSQLDSRWSSKRYGHYLFGPTGCVPTSLAMIFTGLSGKTVLPTQVGDYIYQNTAAFNKLGPGTASNGIAKAIDKWGYKHQVLKSPDAIKNSLLSGNPVLLAVGPSVFVNYPSTHELVLSDYQNGKVKVSDPYTKSLSGWHSLDYLWNVRSRVAEDNELGSPAIAVKRF